MPETDSKVKALRKLPSVDRVLSHPAMQFLAEHYLRNVVVNLIRSQLEDLRTNLLQNGGPIPDVEDVATKVANKANELWRISPQPVINATGVIIHTNLGRAPLSRDSIEAFQSIASGYADLEIDLGSGIRGSRQTHIEQLLRQLTGAESALVVNNNASAVLLALAALSTGKEVIVSRGEAVEIGGGFRIPDVLRQSGARLVEVGTTNRTNVEDYEHAINEDTAALLRVHPSNFRISGFTKAPTVEELTELGRKYDVPVLYDLGSGCLLDTTDFGLAYEPTVQESVRSGISLTLFSGDKLLGGPQAGIAVGSRQYIKLLERHPLSRALRIDKLNLSALSTTLMHYLKGEALHKIPIWQMIALPPEVVESRAHNWVSRLGPQANVEPGLSTIGGGSLPGESLPTWLVSINKYNRQEGANSIAHRLRTQDPPIIARIQDGHILLDPRTVLLDQDDALVKGVKNALGHQEHGN